MKDEYTKLLDHLHDLFPVPEHFNFQLLPSEKQHRIIGQGEVMSELVKYLESFEDNIENSNFYATMHIIRETAGKNQLKILSEITKLYKKISKDF